MFNWFKKESQVDVTKELKPGSEKYKGEGTDGKIVVNPKPGQYAVKPNIQQTIEKGLAEKYKSDAPKIPAAEVKKYTKAELEAHAVKTEKKDKLQFPTKQAPGANVKQPGTEYSSDAASKTYKSEGPKEKMDIPTKQTQLPNVPIAVDTDDKLGKQFKPDGDKSKLIINPPVPKMPAGQQSSNVSPSKYINKGDTAKPPKKSTTASGINWFKKTAEETDVPADDSPQQAPAVEAPIEGATQTDETAITEAALSDETATIIIKAAIDCPDCFNKIIDYINHAAKRKTTAMEETDQVELDTITQSMKEGTATEAQKARAKEIIEACGCPYMEKKAPQNQEQPEGVAVVVVEDETDEALSEIAEK